MKQAFKTILLLTLLAAVLTGCGTKEETAKETEPKANETMTDLNAWFETSETSVKLLVNGVPCEERALREDGSIYLPITVLNELDDRFYWNSSEEQMIVCDAENMYYFWPDLTHHRKNEEMLEDERAALIVRDTEAYVCLDTVQAMSDLSCTLYNDPDRLVLYGNAASVYRVETTGETVLRTEGSTQGEIVVKSSDQAVYVGSTSVEGWMMAVTADGYFGYLETDDATAVTEEHTNTVYEPDASVDRTRYSHILTDSDIRLVWHQVFSEQSGSDLQDALAGTSGITVVSPTWFSVIATDGSISSYANASYVEKAHELGLQVWALIDDFTKGVPGIDVLSNSDARSAVINTMVGTVLEVGADGINVDFEYITEESAPHYLEFLRELSVSCRKNGLILSVDDYNPVYGDTYYKLSEQSYLADYVIIMAYDEHTGGSSETGSVASLPYVNTGITEALKLVPKEQLIVGIPFFTRHFTTVTVGEDSEISSEAMGMDTAKAYGDEHGAVWTWDETLGQYYAKFEEEDGSVGEIWLEDTDSLSEKLTLIQSFDVAGTAAWKLGLESPDVWSLFTE